ncbi:MAG TPA: helix-turn-helix domain-containing protein [Pseudonocardiaceae bacterium]
MADRSTAGTLLRQARVRAGLSQAELARRTGVRQSVISVYEAGRRQPSLPTLSALVEATGTNLDVRLGPVTPETMSRSLADRVHTHADEINAAAEVQGVKVLGLFGSVARGEERPDSDVDLLLDVPKGVGLFALGRLASRLRELLGAEVDLVPEAGLKPGIRESVLADLRSL